MRRPRVRGGVHACARGAAGMPRGDRPAVAHRWEVPTARAAI